MTVSPTPHHPLLHPSTFDKLLSSPYPVLLCNPRRVLNMASSFSISQVEVNKLPPDGPGQPGQDSDQGILHATVLPADPGTCTHTFLNLSCRIPSHRVLQMTSSLPEPNQLKEMVGVVLYWTNMRS